MGAIGLEAAKRDRISFFPFVVPPGDVTGEVADALADGPSCQSKSNNPPPPPVLALAGAVVVEDAAALGAGAVALLETGAAGEEKSSNKLLDALGLLRPVVAAAGAGVLSFPPNKSNALLEGALLLADELFLAVEEPAEVASVELAAPPSKTLGSAGTGPSFAHLRNSYC